jgi:tetratricopeptide (TPR) repeat protein
MAYVRRRGNQLVIVHGEREPGTGKVQQRILFTLYSKAEALEVLGRGKEKGSAGRFRGLFEHQYPEQKLDWKAIHHAIAENLDALPDTYDYRSQRLHARFREDLCAFTRQLILSDPQDLTSAAELIQAHRHELGYIAELIDWRLKLRDQKETEWNADNPFNWRFALQGRQVPVDTEEAAAALYERGEYDRAEAVFQLLVDCFEGYAEGYNYLGLIALEQRRLDVAIERFRKTIELGRKLFPARMRKASYWADLSTRPYMRGLRNLALTLNEAGRFDEALAICDRLVDECGDEQTATWHRATISLNTGRWKLAADMADASVGLDPSGGFIAAFAQFERGHREDALRGFLHAALNFPVAARMLAGGAKRPEGPKKSREEARDHNSGISLRRSLHAYLAKQSAVSRRFFREVLSDARVVRLLEESADVVHRWEEEHRTGGREGFDRMQLMRSRGFAAAEASKLRDLVAPGGSGPGAVIH